MSNFLKFEDDVQTPKYMQIVNTVISDIECGIFKIGDRIPSINETSFEYYLSRDTVEKAYRILKNRGIIRPVRGKGYYVTSSLDIRDLRVLLVASDMGQGEQAFYNTLKDCLGDKARIDIVLHNGNSHKLEEVINDNLGKHFYYLVMPVLSETHSTLLDTINKIPEDKLILLNSKLTGLKGKIGIIYEDYVTDLQEALTSVNERIDKYSNLKLIFNSEVEHAERIKEGFTRYCGLHSRPYEIMQEIHLAKVKKGDLYIVYDDNDLIELIELCHNLKLKIGSDIGIISNGDSPFKRILEGGITIISTDFNHMGKIAAEFIINKKLDIVKNPFNLILRKSF